MDDCCRLVLLYNAVHSIQQTEQIPTDPRQMGAKSTTTSNHPSSQPDSDSQKLGTNHKQNKNTHHKKTTRRRRHPRGKSHNKNKPTERHRLGERSSPERSSPCKFPTARDNTHCRQQQTLETIPDRPPTPIPTQGGSHSNTLRRRFQQQHAAEPRTPPGVSKMFSLLHFSASMVMVI